MANTPLTNDWQRSAVSGLLQWADMLARPVVRWLAVAVSILVLAYALYLNVWRPLLRPVDVPAGVSPTNPELNVEELQQINAKRVERVQRGRANFVRYNSLFVPRRE